MTNLAFRSIRIVSIVFVIIAVAFSIGGCEKSGSESEPECVDYYCFNNVVITFVQTDQESFQSGNYLLQVDSNGEHMEFEFIIANGDLQLYDPPTLSVGAFYLENELWFEFENSLDVSIPAIFQPPGEMIDFELYFEGTLLLQESVMPTPEILNCVENTCGPKQYFYSKMEITFN